MSGDVQPRKRKDKRRKKEDAPVTEEVNTNFSSDETIHIFKESSTGGNVCAKIVFFLLLGGLAVMVGLILTEYRGSSDVDTPIAESRFAQVLDGWVDESQAKHDEHEEPLEESGEHEHDEDDGHMEEHDEHEDEEDEEHEEEEEHEKEDDEPTAISEEEEEEEPTAASEEEEEDDDDDNDDDDEGDEDDEQMAAASEEEEEEALEERTTEENEEVTNDDEDDDDDDDDDDDEDDNDDNDNDEEDDNDEVEQKEEEKEEDDDQDDDDDDDDDNDDKDEDASEEIFGEIPGVTESAEEQDSQADDEKDDDDDDDDNNAEEDESGNDDTASPEEGDEDTEKGEEIKGEQLSGEDSDEEPEPSGIALKFGVGVALVLVAHVVLVRKWNTDETSQGGSSVEEHAPETASRDEEEMEESEYSEEEQEASAAEQPFRVETYEDLLSKYRSTTDKKEAPISKHQKEEMEDEEEEEEIEEEEEEEIVPKTKKVTQKEESEEEIESEEEEEEEEEEEVELPKLQRASARKPIEDTDPEDEDEDDEDEEQQSVPVRKAPASSGEQSRGYANEDITNEDDLKIHSQLDVADDEENPEAALQLFEAILSLHPQSPRANYGKARALDRLAEMKHSNVFLEKCIAAYSQVMALGATVPDKLFLLAANRCIDRMRFRGQHLAAIPVHKKLIEHFPNDPAHANQLAVTYLMVNRVEDARQVLKATLKRWPDNGFAQVHYGFILKTTDNNNEVAVEYLTRGIASREEGTIDGRFFFQLGDALARLNRQEEAVKVYEVGVREGLFLSKYQRSLYNVNHLHAQPWWTPEETTYAEHFKKLVTNWKVIREEGLAALSGNVFLDEAENLRDIGDWKQFELYARGRRIAVNCGKAPVTCRLISEFPAARDCRRGQAKFSVMHPGTHVWPHCGPTNCRLRSHLGLVVPKDTFIRVAEETRSWEEGKLFIFDDSFEHEVWHNGTGVRLVLIVDVWHPDLTEHEKRSLPAI